MRLRLTVSLAGCLGLAVAALALMLAAPAMAQSRRESTLNEVTLNFSATDVLQKRGLPHYIGPALPGADAIEKILNPPPELMSAVAGAPAAPAGPGMPDPNGVAGPPKPKPEEEYIVWMYEGNSKFGPNPGQGFSTYVIFDKFGKVVGVVLTLTSPTVIPSPNIQTSSVGPNGERVGFGTRLIDMVKVYDWPDPFVRIDKCYFCAYPDRNITISVDTATRKVVGMSLGMPLTVIRTAEKSADGNNPFMGGPGALPGGVVMPR